MADSFFGFNTELPHYENETFGELDPSLTRLESEKEIDLVNDDTFGSGALGGDWEAAHKKLSTLHDGSIGGRVDHWSQEAKPADTGGQGNGTEKPSVLSRTTDLDEEEEIIEQSLKSVMDDDDDGESTAVYQSPSAYKDIPVRPAPAWEVSPLSSPTSSNSLQELISPSSNIWSSPVRTQLDKENANKGSVNVQSPLASRQPKPEERKVPQRRPFSPAFEDDAIVKAMPKLHPPSDFVRKPPIPSNAISLEELERELAHTTPVRGTPDIFRHHGMSQPPPSHGRPPPGIPMPMTTPPPGFPMPPPQGFSPQPMPPRMFQGRQFTGHQPLPNMPNPGLGLLGSRPVSLFPQPPFHLVHSDPGHLRQRGGLMDRHGMPPPFPRFSSPQMHNRRPMYDNRFSQPLPRHRFDNRQPYGQFHQRPERTERYQQHTVSDLERKIHNILSNLDDERNEGDPYAGLMTRREKEWIMKIQLLQLTSQNPDLDDFYYQTYIKRKVAKERAQRGEGVESSGGRRSGDNRPAAGQMGLPHFQREERDYKPVEFQGSLGKVSASSVQHPRQMVDIGHLSKASEQEKQDNNSSSAKESRRRRQLMVAIEKAYDLLMCLEDLERRLLHTPDSERNVFDENKQSIVDKLFGLFKLKIAADLSEKVDDEFFIQLMSIRKGKVLLGRVLPTLSQQQAGTVLLSLTRNLSVVMKKDSQDEVLSRLIGPVSSAVEMASAGVTVQCTMNTVHSAGSSLSSVLISQFGASLLNTLLYKTSSVSGNGENKETWSILVNQVARGFQDTPIKVVTKNLEAANRLVQLLSHHTNQYTTTTLQEHLRLASSTKQIKA